MFILSHPEFFLMYNAHQVILVFLMYFLRGSFIPFLFYFLRTTKGQGGENSGSIPIVIKDEGVDELHEGDVSMIFYITVTNNGRDFIRLYVNSTRCCQKITKDDTDCESMRLYGGDMGNMYPWDPRNLTLIYANLYLHDRAGSCDIEIRDAKENVIRRTVSFNTTLVRDDVTLIPRLMKQYYSLENVDKCSGVDENPLNKCEHYDCEIRYSGHRNYFNHSSGRCMPVPECSAPPGEEVAYVVETNTCRRLQDQMTDFTEFHGGKPSVHGLTHAHGYPINVKCHNGLRDPTGGRWCECTPGWTSAPFDHSAFDPDLQVYHMCTVWMGGEGAPGMPPTKKIDHSVTNIIIFSMLGVVFLLLCFLLCWVVYTRRRTYYGSDESDDDEKVGLTTESALYSSEPE